MPLSDADAKTAIRNEVGDPNNTLATIINIMWAGWADKRLIDWNLQYLYTKRSAIDVRLAEEQQSTDIALQPSSIQDRQSQRFDHLAAMYADVQAEIQRVEAMVRARRVPRPAALTKVTPESPPFPDSPSANDPRYSGDPYRRFFGPKRW